MTSLRSRLVLTLLPGVLIVFALTGALLAFVARDALLDELDAGLLARARALGSLFERDDEQLEFDYAGQVMTAFEDGPQPEYFEVRRAGREIVRSPTLADAHLPERVGTLDAPAVFDLALPDGRAGRAVGLRVPVQEDVEPRLPIEQETFFVELVVAVSREPVDARLSSLGGALAASAGVALLLLAACVTFGVRRALRPVERLADDVARIDASTLDARLDGQDVPDELRPMVARLDGLLARLDEAFARQRRMTGAMAHELRTPLAELRSAADVSRRWPDDPALRDALLETADVASARLTSSVEAVMRFCRVESGHERAEVRPIALRGLVESRWSALARRADERRLHFADDVPDEVCIASDAALLGLVLDNLLGNAAEFASAGTIRVEVAPHDDSRRPARGAAVDLRICNPASDLHPDDVPRLTEPFWRADPARTGDAHSGFGLTLASAVARLLEAELRFELVNGVLTAVLAGLPRHDGSSSLRSSSRNPAQGGRR